MFVVLKLKFIQKGRGFYKNRQSASQKKYKLVTFQPKAYRKHLSLCPRSEKPSNFDYFTVMVVFLLVYMKLLL